MHGKDRLGSIMLWGALLGFSVYLAIYDRLWLSKLCAFVSSGVSLAMLLWNLKKMDEF